MTKSLLFAALLVVAGCKTAPPLAASSAQTFTAERIGGGLQVFDPAALQRPTLLVFWASWCATCKAELPAVLELQRSQQGQLDLLGISVDEQTDKAEGYAQEAKLPYPNVLDPKLEVADLFKVKGTPSFVLVAKNGEVKMVSTAIDEPLLSAIALAVQ